MYRIALLLAVLALSACSVTSQQVAADMQPHHPGCELKGIESIRNINGSDQQVLVTYRFQCPGATYVQRDALRYTKAASTGFTSYCCAKPASFSEMYPATQ